MELRKYFLDTSGFRGRTSFNRRTSAVEFRRPDYLNFKTYELSSERKKAFERDPDNAHFLGSGLDIIRAAKVAAHYGQGQAITGMTDDKKMTYIGIVWDDNPQKGLELLREANLTPLNNGVYKPSGFCIQEVHSRISYLHPPVPNMPDRFFELCAYLSTLSDKGIVCTSSINELRNVFFGVCINCEAAKEWIK